MIFSGFAICFIAVLPTARVRSYKSPSAQPQVALANGTYEGTSIPDWNLNLFLGLPYAQSPAGSLRYMPAQSLNETWTGVRKATTLPSMCPQYPSSDAGTQSNISMNEDCLALNIVSLAGLDHLLPVVVWIHGGSYQTGYSFTSATNMTYLVKESMDMGKPVIGISINYRLAYFGFLASNEILNTQNANLGLRDQVKAFEWIQENIAAFGGDPSKVTLWGESSGAQAIGCHLIAHDGQDKGLFRAAILQSGGATVDAYNGTDYYQEQYDRIVSRANCSTAYDTLDCLRQVPYDALWNILNRLNEEVVRFDYMPIIDGDLLPRWPHLGMSEGKSVAVPLITGCNTDEGTLFSPTNLNTSEDVLNYLLHSSHFSLKPETVSELMALYPDDAKHRSPYSSQDTFPALGFADQYPRISSMLGDYLLIAANRFNAETSTKQGRDTWAYRFDLLPPGDSPQYGVSHGTEVPLVFGVSNPSLTASQNATAMFMRQSWISFIHDLTPAWNESWNSSRPSWLRYKNYPLNMVFGGESCSLESDEYRKEEIAFINNHLLEFNS